MKSAASSATARCAVVMRKIGFNRCPYCAETEVYASRPKNWLDEMCGVFFLQVARCHACMRRHYRPLLLASAAASPVKKPIQNTSNEERRDRSA
jgi:hypothetical protein